MPAMGLFDKKKKGRDDFDSPVEQVDLSTAGTTITMTPDDEDDEVEGPSAAASKAPTSASSSATGRPPATPPADAKPERRAPVSTYGIDDAIQLMRTLPQENVELVVRVVKHTLESTKIDISAIIDDASQKQQRIESRIGVLKDAIADLEREIQVRKTEIDELETDHRETTKVKERLVLAEKLTAGRPPERESMPTPNPDRRPRRPTGEIRLPRTKPPTAPPQPASVSSQASAPAAVTAVEGSGPTAAGSITTTPTHTVVPKK
jgi:hypothetical protein